MATSKKEQKKEEPKDEAVQKQKLETVDFLNGDYVINGTKDWPLPMAMRMWKTQYRDDVPAWQRAIIKHEIMNPLRDYVLSLWDSIEPIKTEEAFAEKNLERRRVMFDKIGVERLFKEMEPKLLDTQTIEKKRIRWNAKLEPYETVYNDVYELYKLDSKKLFPDENNNRAADVYSVRCSCPSTDRQYWIYVPEEAALGTSGNGRNNAAAEGKADAIRAIAWTIMIDVTNPGKIYRQGDVIVIEMTEDSKPCTPVHCTKEQYLNLFVSET